MYLNEIKLIGIATEPTTRNVGAKSTICTFGLVTKKYYKDQSGKWIEQDHWHNVVAWNKLGERAQERISKGDEIYVHGSVEYSKYTDKNGQTKTATNIVAERIENITHKPKEIEQRTTDNLGI